MGRLVLSVSQNAVVQAELAILGCDRCDKAATIPFWHILDSFRRDPEAGTEVVYILPVLATCPNCRSRIDEITLVEPKFPPVSRSTTRFLLESKVSLEI
jgi:hypothetical protein